jgi:imidazolonepropionase
MIESLPMVMHIACCQLRMTPEEVLVACTANAAAAIGVADRRGAIDVGYEADLTILETPSLAEWFYTPGRDRVDAVIKAGRVVHSAQRAAN